MDSKEIMIKIICNSIALRNKQPEIIENNTAIISKTPLSIWDFYHICSISEDFNYKPELHFNGVTTKITFMEVDCS